MNASNIERNIFNRVIDGDIPGVVLVVSKTTGAILTNKASQPGHSLIIPRREGITRWYMLEQDEKMEFSEVSAMVMEALDITYTGRVARELVSGFEIPQYHRHLIPVENGKQVTIQTVIDTTLEQRKIEGEKIGKVLRKLYPSYRGKIGDFEICI